MHGSFGGLAGQDKGELPWKRRCSVGFLGHSIELMMKQEVKWTNDASSMHQRYYLDGIWIVVLRLRAVVFCDGGENLVESQNRARGPGRR